MTEQFEQDESTIIQTLQAAGWSKTKQAEALGTASLTYDNAAISLEVEQTYGQRELVISLGASDGRELVLFADYGGHLDDLLQALVASQDDITGDNFRDHARSWLAACPTIYVQADEDAEPQLLTPD